MLTTKFTPTSLPNSQNSIHPVRVVNGQTATIAKTFPMAQLTSIVIAAPGTRLAGPQTVQISKPNIEKQVQINCLLMQGFIALLGRFGEDNNRGEVFSGYWRYPCSNGSTSCRMTCSSWDRSYHFLSYGPLAPFSPASMFLCSLYCLKVSSS